MVKINTKMDALYVFKRALNFCSDVIILSSKQQVKTWKYTLGWLPLHLTFEDTVVFECYTLSSFLPINKNLLFNECFFRILIPDSIKKKKNYNFVSQNQSNNKVGKLCKFSSSSSSSKVPYSSFIDIHLCLLQVFE